MVLSTRTDTDRHLTSVVKELSETVEALVRVAAPVTSAADMLAREGWEAAAHDLQDATAKLEECAKGVARVSAAIADLRVTVIERSPGTLTPDRAKHLLKAMERMITALPKAAVY